MIFVVISVLFLINFIFVVGVFEGVVDFWVVCFCDWKEIC